MKKLLLLSSVAGLLSFHANTLHAQATLVSQFDFNGNKNDLLSTSTCTSLGNTSETYSNGVLSWSSDSVNNRSGFRVNIPDAVFTETDFSVAITFSIPDMNGYRKLVDFWNQSSDQGFYNNGGGLEIYSAGGTGSTVISADSMYTVLFTRRASDDSAKAYLLTSSGVSLESYGLDAGQDYVAKLVSTDRVLCFFADDSSTFSEYSTRGRVDQIRIWNGIATLGDLTTNVHGAVNGSLMNIYPSPARDNISIVFNAPQTGKLMICDASGRTVRAGMIGNTALVNENLSDLAPGIYFVRFNESVMKFIKE